MKRIDQSNQQLLANVKASLDQSTNELDQQLLFSLAARRNLALHHQQRRSFVMPNWAIACATVFGVVIMVWLVQPLGQSGLPVDEELSLLTASDDLEFIEDIDFYMWLDNEQQLS